MQTINLLQIISAIISSQTESSIKINIHFGVLDFQLLSMHD